MLEPYAILPQDRAIPHQKMEALMLRHITNIYRALLFLGLLLGGGFFNSGQVAASSTSSVNGQFLARDHLIIDLKSGVEWMRCSVGQQWDGSDCTGDIIRLSHADVAKAIVLANEQLGGAWRLPNRAELEGLVCGKCADVKIHRKIFPQTVAEPYWTGEVNGFAARHFWSVNFMTGYTYGRFFPQQELAVRLVRDR
jgi:hypothetical protein